MKLSTLGEDRLLAQVLPRLEQNRLVIRGVGDDCAVVRLPSKDDFHLLKTDCIIEGIHFTKRTSPRLVGWKAMARSLSDFAAMAGVPQFALVTLIVPGTRTLEWTKKLYAGLKEAGRKFDVTIVGGETSNSTGATVVSVSLSGFV